MGSFWSRGNERNDEFRAPAPALASSTLHRDNDFGIKGCGIFNRARAAAFKNRNWTGGLEETQTFAIRSFVKGNPSTGGGFSSD